jgi:hypothetical protein
MKRCCRELKRFIARKTLLARRTAQVPIGKDATSGMGVVVETKRPFPPVPKADERDITRFNPQFKWITLWRRTPGRKSGDDSRPGLG